MIYVDPAAVVERFSNASCAANFALRGGVAYLGGGATLAVNSSHFEANQASFGGVYYADASSRLVVDRTDHNGTFTTSAGSGGALFAALQARVALTDSRFAAGAAKLGGALYTEYVTSLAVAGSTFERNSATQDAGAVHVLGDAPTTFDGCDFVENVAQALGGAFYLDSITTRGNLRVARTRIARNRALAAARCTRSRRASRRRERLRRERGDRRQALSGRTASRRDHPRRTPRRRRWRRVPHVRVDARGERLCVGENNASADGAGVYANGGSHVALLLSRSFEPRLAGGALALTASSVAALPTRSCRLTRPAQTAAAPRLRLARRSTFWVRMNSRAMSASSTAVLCTWRTPR